VHLSPLDGEIALSHKLTDSGARIVVTSNLSALLPTALKFLDKGLLDRLIVCEDDNWARSARRRRRCPIIPPSSPTSSSSRARPCPRNGRRYRPTMSRCCNIPAAPPGLPKGAMLSHGNLTSAVSVYDVWGKPARLERNAIERVICVLPLFHIYALTVVLLSSIRRGNLISLHQRFDVDAVMRDIEVKRATAFPGVPTMWIAIAAVAGLDKRDLSSLVSVGSGGAPLPVEGRADPGAPGRHEAEERLGHDRDLLARHRPSQGRAGQARLDRPDAAGYRDGRGVA
jgi:long-chain acyl-CoA synthetase